MGTVYAEWTVITISLCPSSLEGGVIDCSLLLISPRFTSKLTQKPARMIQKSTAFEAEQS
jgi:hypothetical protein